MRALKKNGRTVRVIDDAKEARKFIEWLRKRKNGIPFAIDFETTGLSADTAQVRLSCISCRKNEAFVIDHFACGSFASFADDLAMLGPWYVFYLNFEGMWFDHEVRDADPVELLDVGHMRRAVQGGGPLKLSTMVKWDLGIGMSKELQNSDWSNPDLTDEQYFYGGLDAIYTRDLGVLWKSKMSAEQARGFHVINDTWRAVSECEKTGMLIDEAYHKTLIKMWEKRRVSAEKSIRKLVPKSVIANLRSKKQISDFLKSVLDDAAIENWPATAKTHQLQTSRDILRQMSFLAPYPFSRFLAGLMVFNRADKYLSTYGETLLTKQALSADGRVHGRLNMAQAVTGRFSSSNPNMQNIPRSPVVRKSFIADAGYDIILADYSGIEVRVLAELSGDQILLHDTIYGDVHSQSAIAIYKHDEKDFLARIEKKDSAAKEQRAKSKGFTFQLLYGAGPPALSITLRSSVSHAEDAVKAWADRYSKAYNYRFYMQEKMNHTGYLDTVSGRTIYIPKRDRSLPVASNYPIQGSAGDVMYCAMQRVYALLEQEGLDIYMMVSVHDELLLLAKKRYSKKAQGILKEGMIQGWLDMFPGSNTDNLVDAVIGKTWADKA